MKTFELPASLLVVIYVYAVSSNAQFAMTNATNSTNTLLPSTGSGPEYAASCVAEQNSYTSGLNSWNDVYNTVEVTTIPLGGDSYIGVDFIANATTLCDGHPRISWDNPVILSSGTITQTHPITGYSTQTDTMGSAYPSPSPSCSINPTDCDPLWAAYSSSLSANATTTFASPIITPPCTNVTVAESWAQVDSSVYGCGQCTIYGTRVQLVYWPVPTSDLTTRDYCASTPTANLTTYNANAVITAYAGKSLGNYSTSGASYAAVPTGNPNLETVTVDGHAFTEGTAYISIGSVWAANRCSTTFGTVTDAILAMPSASVLSLRYAQDHFEYLMATDAITGYPVNYGDFVPPIPWSAWDGQNMCSGYWGGPQCDIIDERSYRPQLAIPPQITELSPDFQDCQMWYNGLFDPPIALTRADAAATPTDPWANSSPTPTAAQPASTAVADTLPTGYVVGSGGLEYGEPTQKSGTNENGGGKSASPTTDSHGNGNQNGGGSSGATKVTSSSSKDSNGSLASYINAGIGGGHSSSSGSSSGGSTSDGKAPGPANEPWTYTFSIDGKEYHATGANNKCVIGSVTCELNGPPQTIVAGVTASYGPNGVVIHEEHVYSFPPAGSSVQSGAAGIVDEKTATFGSGLHTAVETSDGGPIVIESHTLTAGGGAATLHDGEIVSAATGGGIVVATEYTLGVSSVSSTSMTTKASASNAPNTAAGSNASPTSGEVAAAATSSTAAAAELFSAHGLSSMIVALFVVAVLGA